MNKIEKFKIDYISCVYPICMMVIFAAAVKNFLKVLFFTCDIKLNIIHLKYENPLKKLYLGNYLDIYPTFFSSSLLVVFIFEMLLLFYCCI